LSKHPHNCQNTHTLCSLLYRKISFLNNFYLLNNAYFFNNSKYLSKVQYE
jgi:hypothetical protein